MPNNLSRKTGLVAFMLLALNLLLVGCGSSEPYVSLSLPTQDAQAAAPAATGSPAAPATAAGSSARVSPEVLATPTGIAGSPTPAPRATTPATARPTATPRPALKPVTGYPGKISFLGAEEALYIARFDGSAPQFVAGSNGARPSETQDGPLLQWPTWSRDGSKLAVICFNIKSGQVAGSDVLVVNQDGKNPVKVQDNSPDRPVFISWSPDGNLLSLLVSNNNSLELRLLDTSKGLQAAPASLRKIKQGSAIYTGWSPDSQQLLIHASSSSTDNTLTLLAAKDSRAQATPLKATPSNFRTPAFSTDGTRLAFSVLNQQTGNEEIFIQDKIGNSSGIIETGGREATFNWSPAGNKLAHSYLIPGGQGMYKGVAITDFAAPASNGKYPATQVVNEPLTSFFWSPDGKKLAYITLNDENTMLAWKLYDLDSKKTTPLLEWYPSDAMVQLIRYFDQYAQTNSLWSPDSKALLFGGYTKDEVLAIKAANTPDEDINPSIYILPVDGAQAGKAQLVAFGSAGFWSK